MQDPETIKRNASERARQMKLGYAGALLPAEAHALMQAGAKLVDVRTRAELGKKIGIEAAFGIAVPLDERGPRHSSDEIQLGGSVAKDTPVMFLCRSGNRSHAAADAATRAGWREAYNILEGFEGERDANGRRNTVGGWKVAGLPWAQS